MINESAFHLVHVRNVSAPAREMAQVELRKSRSEETTTEVVFPGLDKRSRTPAALCVSRVPQIKRGQMTNPEEGE